MPEILSAAPSSSWSLAWLAILVDASLKGALLLIAAGILSVGLRGAAAATRHVLWALSLAGVIVLPVLSGLMPHWSINLLPASVAPPWLTEPGRPARLAESPMPRPVYGTGPSPFLSDRMGQAKPPSLSMVDPQRSTPTAESPIFLDVPVDVPAWPVWTLTIWCVGALLVGARFFLGLMAVQRMIRRATQPDADWLVLMEHQSQRLRLSRQVTLLRTDRAAVPMTGGIAKSVVFLPHDADRWPTDRRQAVLLHELSHVQRRDGLTQALAHLACALYWFSPVVWFAARQLRIEREHACDDRVLALGTRASEYADHLIDIARACLKAADWSSAATVAMARRSALEDRVRAILDPRLPRRPRTPAAAAFVGVLVGVLVLSLSIVQPSAKSAEPRLEQTPPVVRGHAAPAKKLADSNRTADPLVGALTNADARVREEAVLELAFTGGRRAVELLIAALRDRDAQVREKAAMGLILRRDRRAVDSLIEALADEDSQVREKAAMALGLQDDRRAVDPLIAALRDRDAQVREKAALALGLLDDDRAVAPLVKALNDRDAQVREQAATALTVMNRPRDWGLDVDSALALIGNLVRR